MRALGTSASHARWLAWAQAAGSRIERISLRKFCLAIFCVALAVRLSAIFALELQHRWDGGAEWENIARNLASTGEFANPYPSPTGPTAHSPPAYPFLLSLVFRAVGTGPEGRLGCLILNAVFHVDPALLPVFFFWTVILAWNVRRQHGAHVISRLVLVLIGVSLALSPWTLRNRRQLGAWMFIRNNFGLELAMAANDSALPMFPWEYNPVPSHALRQLMSRHPFGSEGERDRIRAVGEAAYNRERLEEALGWIRRNPGRFAVLSLQRFRYFWFYPGMGRRYRNVVLYPMVILAGWGLLRMLRRHRFAGLLFLGDWVAYPLTYYVISVSGRYRYPMEWTILLLSCYAVWEWWNARRPPIHPRGLVPHARPEPHPRAA